MTDTPTALPWFKKRPVSWHVRGFRQLVRAWLFTNIADSALFLMLAVWVKELTGSDGAAALVFVMLGLPAFLAPFIGQVADRMSRKTLLAAANLTMVAVLLAMLMVNSPDQVWVIYVVTFSYGAMGYLTGAAGSGLLRDLLEDNELASGNGVLQTIDQGFRLVSPLIGTALYVAFGPSAVIILTAICFALTAFFMTRLEITESPPAKPEHGVGYWSEVGAGFRHVFKVPSLRVLTIVLATAFGAIGLVNAAVFPIMEQGLGVEAAFLGVFVSIQGIGALTGGATAASVIRRIGESRAVALGITLISIGMIPMLGTSIPGAFIGMAIIGLGVPWTIVAYSTHRQRLTPANLQGRASAAANVAVNLPQTLILMVAAAIIDIIDYRALVVGTVVVCFLAGIPAWRHQDA